MNKASQIFLLLILSLNCFAGKVAYLIIEDFPDPSYPQVSNTKSLKVIDLDTGTLLKTIEFESNINKVFVSKDSHSVYVLLHSPSTIYKLDATKLTVQKHWDNLPIEPYNMGLSSDNNHLILTEFLGSKIYSLDLDTDNLTEVFDNNKPMSKLLYNQSLDKFVLFAGSNTDTIKVTTLDSDNFTVLNEFNITTPNSNQVSSIAYLNSDGTTLYIWHEFTEKKIHAYDMSTGSKKWDYSNGNRILKFGYENNGEVVLFTEQKTVMLDANSGLVHSEINMHLYFSAMQQYNVNKLTENKALVIDNTYRICGTFNCFVNSHLKLQTYDFSTGNIKTIFEDRSIRGGAFGSGRFLGDNLYQPPKVPTLSTQALLLFVFATFFVAFNNMKKRPE